MKVVKLRYPIGRQQGLSWLLVFLCDHLALVDELHHTGLPAELVGNLLTEVGHRVIVLEEHGQLLPVKSVDEDLGPALQLSQAARTPSAFRLGLDQLEVIGVEQPLVVGLGDDILQGEGLLGEALGTVGHLWTPHWALDNLAD